MRFLKTLAHDGLVFVFMLFLNLFSNFEFVLMLGSVLSVGIM